MKIVSCASCSSPVVADAVRCPYCGADLRGGLRESTVAAPVAAGAVPAALAGVAATDSTIAGSPDVSGAAVSVSAATVAAPSAVGVPKRLFAWVIDLVLGTFVGLVVTAFIPQSETITRGQFLTFAVIMLLIWYAYLAASEAIWSTTLGKRLLGAKVGRPGGLRCGVGAALARNVTKALLGLPTVLAADGALPWRASDLGPSAGWLAGMCVVCGLIVTLAVMLTSDRRARVGDILAGTAVVSRKSAAAVAGEAVVAGEAASAAESTPLDTGAAAVQRASRASELAQVADTLLQPPPAAADQPSPAPGGGRVPWRWRRAFAGLLVAFAPEWALAILGLIVAGGAAPAAPTNGDAIFIVVSTVVFDSWWVAWAWGFSLRRFRLPLAAWGFRRPSRVIFWVVPLALVAALLVDGLWAQIVTSPVPEDFPHNALGMSLSAVGACLLAPMFEETFFRGFFFQGLETSMGTVWAALLSAAVFAGIHLDLAGFVPLFSAGLLLTWAFRRTGSIWGSIALHALYNGVAVLAWILS